MTFAAAQTADNDDDNSFVLDVCTRKRGFGVACCLQVLLTDLNDNESTGVFSPRQIPFMPVKHLK